MNREASTSAPKQNFYYPAGTVWFRALSVLPRLTSFFFTSFSPFQMNLWVFFLLSKSQHKKRKLCVCNGWFFDWQYHRRIIYQNVFNHSSVFLYALLCWFNFVVLLLSISCFFHFRSIFFTQKREALFFFLFISCLRAPKNFPSPRKGGLNSIIRI